MGFGFMISGGMPRKSPRQPVGGAAGSRDGSAPVGTQRGARGLPVLSVVRASEAWLGLG